MKIYLPIGLISKQGDVLITAFKHQKEKKFIAFQEATQEATSKVHNVHKICKPRIGCIPLHILVHVV